MTLKNRIFRRPKLTAFTAVVAAMGSGVVPTASSAQPPARAQARDNRVVRFSIIRTTWLGGGGSNARLRTGGRGSVGKSKRVRIGLRTIDAGRWEGDHQRDVLATYEKGLSRPRRCGYQRRTVLVLGYNADTDDLGQSGHRATAPNASPGVAVVAFQRGAADTSKTSAGSHRATGRGGHLASGTTANKATKAALVLPGRPRRPCGEAQQRRLRGPQHRHQLAAPHLRQPRLQSHRRQ